VVEHVTVFFSQVAATCIACFAVKIRIFFLRSVRIRAVWCAQNIVIVSLYGFVSPCGAIFLMTHGFLYIIRWNSCVNVVGSVVRESVDGHDSELESEIFHARIQITN
jgi:hypothetical protein